MDHAERYAQLLSPGRRSRLLEAIRQQGYFKALKITEAAVVDADPVPYVRFKVEADSRIVARSGGLYLDLGEVVDNPPSDRYYLPYVGLTPAAKPGDEAHELRHLLDLIELIRKEPEFPAEAERLGAFNIRAPELLEPSVRFEVRKLFLLEVPALEQEFQAGTRHIDMPFLPGKALQYRCESQAEFTTLWLASYLDAFKNMYVERFPEQTERIKNSFEAATNEYGHELLGERPWTRVMQAWKEMPDRVVSQALRQSQVVRSSVKGMRPKRARQKKKRR